MNSFKRLLFSHKTKTALVLLAILSAGAILVWRTVAEADHGMRSNLLRQTQLLALTLKIDGILALTGTQADLRNPEYLRFKEEFAAARAVIPLCRFIYLMGRRTERSAAAGPDAPQPGGSVYFLVDVGTEKEAQPGQVYDAASKELGSAFESGTPFVEGPLADEWGVWLSGIVPIKNPKTKDTLAVLGTDIDAHSWNQRLLRAALPPVLLTLILAVVVLARALWFNHRVRSGPLSHWVRHHNLALAIAAGLMITGCFTWMTRQHEVENRRLDFEQLVTDRTEAVAAALLSIRHKELEALAHFYESDEEVLSEEFQHFTTYLAKNAAVQVWEWIPAVPAADKSGFEAQVRAAGAKDFEVWQKDASGKRVPATARGMYFPVLQVAPMAGNEAALGFDLGSEPRSRQALEAATRSGLTTASEPLPLTQETGSEKGLILCRPVYTRGEPRSLRGFVLAVLRMGDVLQVTTLNQSASLEISLLRRDAPPEILATSRDAAGLPRARISVTCPVLCGGDVFAVTASAGPDYLRIHRLWNAWWIALVGAGLTAAKAVVIRTQILRREEMERLVDERSRQLKTSQAHFSELAWQSGTVVWEVDSQGLFTYASEVSESVTGYRPDELINRLHFYDLHPEAGREEFKVAALEAFARKDSFKDFVNEIQAKDGRQVWVSTNGIPVLNTDGTLKSYRGSDTEITERKLAEVALRESESRLRAITDAAYDGIIMIDASDSITYWNPAAERILGYSSTEALGQHVHSLLAPPRDRAAHLAALPSFQKTGQGTSVGKTRDLEALRKDGQEISVQLTLSAIRLNDAWLAVAIMRDVTVQKKAESVLHETNRKLEEATARATEMTKQAQLANSAKSEFLANMSHEIRTPMNGVIGMTALLLKTPLNDDQRSYINDLRASGDALMGIINDILDFSKIEAGKLDLEALDFNLATLLDAFQAILSRQARIKDLEFSCVIDPDVPLAINGDPGRLRQILLNLAGNAIKFTPRGKVSVQVSLVSTRASIIKLRFAVRDTGVGIPEHKQRLLFQKFSQMDSSNTRTFGGTGLGLAISKQLVELMDGEIGVSSVVGQGSEFWFTAYFASALDAIPAPPAPPRVNRQHWHCMRVLLAEDNIINRKVALGFLENLHLEVDAVINGSQAIEALTTTRYDLVLMDMQMSPMDGLEATRLIRASHSAVLNPQIPIIAMTANAIKGAEQSCLASGMDDYMTKPLTPDSLAAMLEKWLPKPQDA